MARKNSAVFEDYSVKVTDGDLVLRDLQLTGWGATAAALDSTTDRGRLWGRITTGNVLQLYRDPGMDSADLVASTDPITEAGTVDIDEANSSGVSGSVDVDYTLGEEQLFDVVVTYADERDIASWYGEGLANELDDDDAYEGRGDRFEALLRDTKREEVDPRLYEMHGDKIGKDDLGRPLVAKVSHPRQLAKPHALFCLYRLFAKRGVQDPRFLDGAKHFKAEAESALSMASVAFDVDADGDVDDHPDATQECERG